MSEFGEGGRLVTDGQSVFPVGIRSSHCRSVISSPSSPFCLLSPVSPVVPVLLRLIRRRSRRVNVLHSARLLPSVAFPRVSHPLLGAALTELSPGLPSIASLARNDVLPSAPFRIGSSLDGPDCPSFGLRLSLVVPLVVLFSPLGLLLFFFLFFFSPFHFLLLYPLPCSASSRSFYSCFLPSVRYQPRPHHGYRRSEDQGQEPRRGTRR